MAFLDFFTGVDSEQVQQDLEDFERIRQRQNAAVAERIREREGALAEEQYLAIVEAQDRENYQGNVEADVAAAFGEGFDEGAANIRGFVGDTVGAVVTTPFKLVPWWLLLTGVAAAFLYFGGPNLFRKPT